MGLTFSLRPLRTRNFALLWSSALVSNVGSWMQAVALGVVITDRTHQPLWTGLVAAAAFVPVGLLAPVGGALADRLDRRRWLIITTLAEAGCATVLAVLSATGNAHPVELVGLAFCGGLAAAVGFPSYQAMLPDLVARDDLLAAVSLSSAQFNLGRVIGPALAGLVLVVGSATWAFAVNAISFGAVVIALVLLRLPEHESGPDPESIGKRIAEGVRVVRAEAGCRAAIFLIAVVALIGSPFIALVPAMAIEAFHRGAGGTSILVTAQGVGAVIGALALAPVARVLGRRRLLQRALIGFPLALVCYGLAPTVVVAGFAMVLVGASYIGVLSGLNTVVQLRAPDYARGRVLGLYMMALGTIYPIGAVIQGAIGDSVGVKAVTVTSGIVLLVAVLAIAVARPTLMRALDDPVGESAVSIDAVPSDVPIDDVPIDDVPIDDVPIDDVTMPAP